AMTFGPRRTLWLDGHRDPDDYEIIHADQTIGRGLPHEQDRPRALALDADRAPAPTHGPNGVARVKSGFGGSGRESLVATTSVDDPACVKTLCFIMNGMIPAI
ncbi:MAG TPA: hypothetical protein VM822_02880, partial [Pseudolabrys sp.]|nr:hypothetical protein [Pseudolabrys sp.]